MEFLDREEQSIDQREQESEDELSEQQIEQLLNQAAVKLRNQVATRDDSERQLRKTPKSSTGFPAPPAQSKSGITSVDPQHLLSAQDRQNANGIRKIEDPVMIRQKKIEVRQASLGYVRYVSL